jgi:hypothetical protein
MEREALRLRPEVVMSKISNGCPHEPPWTETGEIVPWRFVLTRRDDILVQLTSFVAYSVGLEFAVDARTNVPDLFSDLIIPTPGILAEKDPEHQSLFASDFVVEAVTSSACVSSARESSDASGLLTATTGIGDRHRWKQGWWLTPLPEGDLLNLAIRWEKAGIDEVVQLDAVQVRAAAHRSQGWTDHNQS